MRLIELKKSIDFAYDNYSYDIQETSSSNTKQFSNMDNVRIVLEELVKVGLVDESDSNYSFLLSLYSDKVLVDINKHPRILTQMSELKASITLLHNWLEKYVVVEETDTSINIKLPELKKLEYFSTIIDLLENSLNEISRIHGGSEIIIERVDHGSIWIVVAVGTAFKFITKAIKDAFDIAQKKVELDQAKELLKRTKLENKAIENFSLAQEAAIEVLLDDYSSQITAKDEKDANGLSKEERRMRYKKALKELTQLIGSGTEFHPALLASQEVIDSFPKFQNQISLKAPIAELPRNSSKKINESEIDKE